MTNSELCKKCDHHTFSLKEGIICSLTSKKPDFHNRCESYKENPELKEKALQEKKSKELQDSIVSHGIRIANYVIDRILFISFAGVFAFILGVILSGVSPEAANSLTTMSDLVYYLIAFVLSFLFYFTLEAATGRTIAKYITNTKVVDESGNRPSAKVIIVRTLCRFIPFDIFSFLGSDARGWHDELSKTYVIRAN